MNTAQTTQKLHTSIQLKHRNPCRAQINTYSLEFISFIQHLNTVPAQMWLNDSTRDTLPLTAGVN